MDWVPVVLICFKLSVLGIGMFFAIKWHYDQDRLSNPVNVFRLAGEIALYGLAIMILFALLYMTFHYLRMLPVGLDFV